MAFYLVRANLKTERLEELGTKLRERQFEKLQPFGRAVNQALTEAKLDEDGSVRWEEEDYCSPPLAQEREAVLDRYFDDIAVEPVEQGKGWALIHELPPLFPILHGPRHDHEFAHSAAEDPRRRS